MALWILFATMFVIGAKFVTSKKMVRIERALQHAKQGLHQSRAKHATAVLRAKDVQKEMEHTEQRVRYMKEILQDLAVRLSQKDDISPDTAIKQAFEQERKRS